MQSFRHPYAEIAAPALAIYAVGDRWQGDVATWRAACRDRCATETKAGQVVEISDATHYLFLDHRDDVLAAMHALAPDLWLLDEPASALDTEGRAALGRVLRAEAARGAAVVVASEDADGMAGIADRLVVFREGRPVLEGTPDDLLRGEAIWEAGGGSTTVAELARAAGVASGRPLTVEEGVARWRR